MVSPRFITVLIAALLLAGAAASARELGRAAVGGRQIAIFEDRTWRFVDELAPSPKNCPPGEVWQSRRLSLSLCIKNGTWTSQGERYFFESLFTDPTSAAYAGIVTEATPLSTQQMKDLVLATVKDNPEIREVRDVSYSTRTINGHELGVLDYTVVLKRGVSFRYRNIYGGIPDVGNLQMMFWASPEQFNEHETAFEELAGTVTYAGR
jgi:hypothetical protein